MKDRRHLWIAHLVPGIMLVFAFDATNPYGYYILLRFVCCAAFVLLAVDYLKSDCHPAWIWSFGFVALLYNPILKIPLDRESWEIANVCTLGLLGGSMLRLGRNKPTP
jgi:hypothetical protein